MNAPRPPLPSPPPRPSPAPRAAPAGGVLCGCCAPAPPAWAASMEGIAVMMHSDATQAKQRLKRAIGILFPFRVSIADDGDILLSTHLRRHGAARSHKGRSGHFRCACVLACGGAKVIGIPFVDGDHPHGPLPRPAAVAALLHGRPRLSSRRRLGLGG